jgi:hypothetical protein
MSYYYNLSLGLATKAKAYKGVGQKECERVWRWKLTLPSELPFWELESWWTPKPLESDCKGQNIFHWGVFYIIGKLLKCKCLKWACMTHLYIWNISYGSLIPDHEMSGINSTSMHAGGVRHTIGKLLTRATILVQTSSRLKVWARSYSPAKL